MLYIRYTAPYCRLGYRNRLRMHHAYCRINSVFQKIFVHRLTGVLYNQLIFHSDRGVQYASAGYREASAEYNIKQSISRKCEPYDNAVAENFFSCLKCELVHHKHYKTRSEAQADIFAYIEAYYNSMRPQSALNWLSPLAYERLISVYAAKVA